MQGEAAADAFLKVGQKKIPKVGSFAKSFERELLVVASFPPQKT